MLQAKMHSPTTNYAPWITNSNNQCAGSKSYSINSVIFANHTQIQTSHKYSWIIDSGATHHITHHLNLLTNFTPVNSKIHLPKGDISTVSHIGSIQLASYLTLQDVLVVPKF